MTLQPVPDRMLSWGFEEDDYLIEELGPLCAVPDCPAQGVEPHHICPRRQTSGPRRLVAVEGQVVGNVAMLCHWHHGLVTGGLGGHKARIRWSRNGDGWIWFRAEGEEWGEVGPLDLRRGRD